MRRQRVKITAKGSRAVLVGYPNSGELNENRKQEGNEYKGWNTTFVVAPHLHNLSPLAQRLSRHQQEGPGVGHLGLALPGNLEIPPGSEPTLAAHGTSLW